ncbi:hypothetical protein [Rhodococcus opacus]|uniref:hypothetical protein n=1 Tax=Rhodococcus opacus TaxID=37919 RepID=UPI0012DB0C68|nr:hypothetical protein [Rhodococcus opacus]
MIDLEDEVHHLVPVSSVLGWVLVPDFDRHLHVEVVLVRGYNNGGGLVACDRSVAQRFLDKFVQVVLAVGRTITGQVELTVVHDKRQPVG